MLAGKKDLRRSDPPAAGLRESRRPVRLCDGADVSGSGEAGPRRGEDTRQRHGDEDARRQRVVPDRRQARQPRPWFQRAAYAGLLEAIAEVKEKGTFTFAAKAPSGADISKMMK